MSQHNFSFWEKWPSQLCISTILELWQLQFFWIKGAGDSQLFGVSCLSCDQMPLFLCTGSYPVFIDHGCSLLHKVLVTAILVYIVGVIISLSSWSKKRERLIAALQYIYVDFLGPMCCLVERRLDHGVQAYLAVTCSLDFSSFFCWL